MMRVEIKYLGEIRQDGAPHDGWAGGVCYDMTHVPTRRVDPTIVDVDVHSDTPQICTDWGDGQEARQQIRQIAAALDDALKGYCAQCRMAPCVCAGQGDGTP